MASYYPTDDLYLNVARGLVRGTTHIHKFGAVPSMSVNTTGTLWDIEDTIYPWASWAAAGTVTVDRASTSDANKQIAIFGLDANYNEVSDIVTLTNATGNASTQSFIRIYRAFVTEGSTTNVGQILIKKGGTTVAAITATKGQTLMAIYTVPAGYTAYMLHGTCSAQAGADATGNMFIRYFGNQAFRTGHSFEVGGDGGTYNYNFIVPIPIPEKSDIDVRIITRSNNGRFTAAFDLLLIQAGLGA